MAKKRTYNKKQTGKKTAAKRSTKNQASRLDLAIVVLFVLSVLSAVLIYGKSGVIGVKLTEILGGLIGIIRYVLPIGIFAVAIKIVYEDRQELWYKLGQYTIFLITIATVMATFQIVSGELLANKELANVVKEHVDMDIDKIVAIEAMGIHLATALSLATDIPFVIIRKRQYGLEGEKEISQKTGYGSSKLYINDLKEGEKILLIDDVVSTGGTLISTLSALKELNIDIKAAVAVIEKGEGKKLVEKETGIPIFSVVKLDVIDGKVVIEKTIED